MGDISQLRDAWICKFKKEWDNKIDEYRNKTERNQALIYERHQNYINSLTIEKDKKLDVINDEYDKKVASMNEQLKLALLKNRSRYKEDVTEFVNSNLNETDLMTQVCKFINNVKKTIFVTEEENGYDMIEYKETHINNVD